MTWQEHVEKWKACTRCLLCEGRNRVVLARGKVPCDILFVGEAPGDSENITGRPFDGPAGGKLDSIIRSAGLDRFRLLFTNLVGCFPAEAKATGDHQPPAEAIKACSPRLVELVRMAQPKMIVLVGDLAKRYVCGQAQFCTEAEDNHPFWIQSDKFLEFVDIVHPAAILRAPIAQQTLMTRRCVVQLAQAVENL